MSKKIIHPPYFKIFALLGTALLIIGLFLLVSHLTIFSSYAIAYSGIAFLLVGGAGMVFYKPRV